MNKQNINQKDSLVLNSTVSEGITEQQANIHHVVGHSDSFSWGYKGTGPFDLGLNTLLHYTGGDLEFAKTHVADFVMEVISKLPERTSAVIPASLIESWIELRQSGLVKSVHGKIEQAPVQENYEDKKAEFIKSA